MFFNVMLIAITTLISSLLGFLTYKKSTNKIKGLIVTLIIGLIMPYFFADINSFIGTLLGILVYLILAAIDKIKYNKSDQKID